jgi:hypothetical protein
VELLPVEGGPHGEFCEDDSQMQDELRAKFNFTTAEVSVEFQSLVVTQVIKTVTVDYG